MLCLKKKLKKQGFKKRRRLSQWANHSAEEEEEEEEDEEDEVAEKPLRTKQMRMRFGVAHEWDGSLGNEEH